MTWLDEGRNAAYALRAELELGSDAIPDIVHLLEDLGLQVFGQPLGEGTIDGALLRTEDICAVLINTSSIASRQRFTAAHELGHWRMDTPSPLLVEEDIFRSTTVSEKRANVFAAHFLMPVAGVSRVINRYVPGQVDAATVVHIQRHFGVSYQSALWHLLNANMISEAQKTEFEKVSSERLALELGYDEMLLADETRRGKRYFPRDYWSRSIRAYEAGVITGDRLGELLGVPFVTLKPKLDSAGIIPEDEDSGV